MENDLENQIRNRIHAVITIASKCGQPITYEEIALMLPTTSKSFNIKKFMLADGTIQNQITIQSGLIVLKGYERLFKTTIHNKLVSTEKMQTAKAFAASLTGSKSYLKILAVTGSVAYGTAAENDDIDIFIVAQKDRMWIAFSRALLKARAFYTTGSIDRKPVDLCLSYVQDEKNFEEEISTRKNLLFAREFLSVRLLVGQKYYYELLNKTRWIKNSLPALYQSKQLKQDKAALTDESSSSSSRMLTFANNLIYVLLGNYLLFKAFLRNLSYRKKGKLSEIFEAKITKNSCLYNSKRYQELERIYSLM